MILGAFDKRIRQAFSSAAMQYDVLSSLQKEIGRELVNKLVPPHPGDVPGVGEIAYILDVGMGTGWMTNRLANLFPDAKVVGIDSAVGMIKQARKKYENLKSVNADARMLPFKNEQFDVVISNLAYQWVPDLEKAFAEAYRLLRKDGTLCLTMFGNETLKELFASFETAKDEKIFVHRLAGRAKIEAALNSACFRDILIETETIKVHFPDMLALIKWLKDIGANILPKNGFIGKELMLEAGDYYKNNFSDRLGIIATFEVVWIKARK